VTIKLNHTIVYARSKRASAAFLTELLGLPPAVAWGPFMAVEVANEVTLDYHDAADPTPQHYCFLVSEPEFDDIFSRIQEREIPYWADPSHRLAGEINTNDGGRGVYFDDPDGHILEIITRPYGSGA
jgi:catechol 2,3-dioxygenase-like lactoylglutathione lyase family enzyme